MTADNAGGDAALPLPGAGPRPIAYGVSGRRCVIQVGVKKVLAAAMATALCGAVQAAEAPVQQTLYRHASLIDGTGGPVRPGMSVLVSGERITAVAPDAGLAAPAGARIVDLAGKYL